MNFFTDALSKRNSAHKQSHLQVHRERQTYLFYLDTRKGLTLTPQHRAPPGGQLQGPRCHPGRLAAPHSGLCAARGCPTKLHACRGGAQGSSPLGFLGLAPPALPTLLPGTRDPAPSSRSPVSAPWAGTALYARGHSP